jgi:hypothetical protein
LAANLLTNKAMVTKPRTNLILDPAEGFFFRFKEQRQRQRSYPLEQREEPPP